MFASWWSIGLGVCLFLGDGGLFPAGCLVDPAAGTTAPYLPREGDLVFYDDRHPLWTLLFTFAGSGPPLHMGIVVKRADGRLAVLEAGPDDTLRVELLDAIPRLHQFRRDFPGTVTVRRCKTTLAPRQSAALTTFAAAQAG